MRTEPREREREGEGSHLIPQVELPKSSIPLAEYKDKTLLFVNVASKCGELVALNSSSVPYAETPEDPHAAPRTSRIADKAGLTPQYKDLQALYDSHKDKGLEIIGFPCNQVCTVTRLSIGCCHHVLKLPDITRCLSISSCLTWRDI